jgi:hypothetical protein
VLIILIIGFWEIRTAGFTALDGAGVCGGKRLAWDIHMVDVFTILSNELCAKLQHSRFQVANTRLLGGDDFLHLFHGILTTPQNLCSLHLPALLYSGPSVHLLEEGVGGVGPGKHSPVIHIRRRP